MGDWDLIDRNMDAFSAVTTTRLYWQKCMCPCYGDTEGMKHKFKAQYCTVANSLRAVALQPYKAVCWLK